MSSNSAYIPLHHKYRPQTFAELVGQEAVATTLTNAIKQQKIAPAYLFTGARGTGKTSSARILAKSLNCIQSQVPTPIPCGTCEICRAIANGSALDVIEIDAASNTGVENIRELIERAQFAPVQCRYKLYVLDEVHMLSASSFAALLKTIEEPPDRVVFVLATTDPQRVLPTIISRCQRFDFRRINLDAMVQHLSTIADKEGIPITADAVQLVAQIAQGGLRDAESLLDQLSLLTGEITTERVWDLVGAVPERDLLALMEAIVRNDAVAALDRTRHLLDRGREPLIMLQNLASFYRDLLIAKTAPDRQDLTAITPQTWSKLCEFVQSLDLALLLRGQQHLRAAEVQIKNTTQPRLWLEVTLIGLLPATTQAQIDFVASSAQVNSPSIPSRPLAPVPAPTPVPPILPTPEPAPASSPATSPAPEPAPPDPPVPPPTRPSVENTTNGAVPPASASQSDLSQIWQQMIDRASPIVKGLLKTNGCLLAISHIEARVGVPSTLIKTAQQKVKDIEKTFSEVVGRPIKVKLESITAVEAAPTPSEPTIQPPARPTPVQPPEHHQSPPPASVAPVPASPPLSPASSPEANSWEADEVTLATKRFAEFFNGQIVDLDDALGVPLIETDYLTNERSNAVEVSEEDDEDIPF